MPYFEIRFMKPVDEEKFDVFDHGATDAEHLEGSGWDFFIPIDYSKLSRYIRI